MLYINFFFRVLKLLLDKVGNKVENLIVLHNDLLEKNEVLLNEKELLLKEVAALKENIKNLGDRLNDVNISKSFETTEEDVGLAKKKINMFLREIDRCIALLNN